MNITKHNPNCRGSAWQLQSKSEDGEMQYRTQCLGCGRIAPVTETEAKNWNRSHELVKVAIKIPEIVE